MSKFYQNIPQNTPNCKIKKIVWGGEYAFEPT